MSILFIAVQCFQCSTMQVKQQKKSSNKWTCVICNEKQSLRKIYSRGYQAKDLRKFVQAFNSARSTSRSDGSGWNSPPSCEVDGGGGSDAGRGKRMDWNEYLDPKEEVEEDLEREELAFPKTSLPSSSRKRKSRPRQVSIESVNFPKQARKFNKYVDPQAEEESGNLERAGFDIPEMPPPCSSPKRKGLSSQENTGSLQFQKKKECKWSEYLGHEDEQVENHVDGSYSPQHVHDLRVEEEVHPDF